MAWVLSKMEFSYPDLDLAFVYCILESKYAWNVCLIFSRMRSVVDFGTHLMLYIICR